MSSFESAKSSGNTRDFLGLGTEKCSVDFQSSDETCDFLVDDRKTPLNLVGGGGERQDDEYVEKHLSEAHVVSGVDKSSFNLMSATN